MELEQNVGGTDRLVRTVLAVALTIVAVDALKNRRYSVVIGAGLGALGFGFNATTCFCGLNNALDIDTTEQ